MISNYTPNSTFTAVEKFFVEKMLELFYRKTLDSHRAKLNNPKWVLHELSQVLFDLHTNHIKSFEKTITPVIHETLRFIDNDDTLSFNAVNKKYFKELLGKADAKNYLHLSHAVKVVLESNKQYTSLLFLKIKNEINELNSKHELELENFNQLSILSDYLATDLINIGYSKNYLYTNTAWIFSNSHKVSFDDCFQWFCNLSIKEEEEFTVIFKLINLIKMKR